MFSAMGLVACSGGTGGPGDPPPGGNPPGDPPKRVEQVVGASGGTVTASSGVAIEVPAGALTGDAKITIEEVSDPPLPSGATGLGKTIQLGPEGQVFSTPVKVKLPWSGPDNLPVVISHAPRGGGTWTTLTENTGFDATHVWAETTSFSWFRPVAYQGAPDAPIVLDKDRPTGWTELVLLGSTPDLVLRGDGLRGDTVVKLFKAGVTTTTVTPVKLTANGLEFKLPAAFTATLGLITIEAKNPQATVGAAAAIYVVKKPALQSLSPSSVDIQKRDDGNYGGLSIPVTVSGTDLPDDVSRCSVTISQSFAQAAVLVAETTAPARTAQGFVTTVTRWNNVKGRSDLLLQCRGVNSNALSITFNLIE